MKSSLPSAHGGVTPPGPVNIAERASSASGWWQALTLLAVFTVTFVLRDYRLGPTFDIHVDELTYLNISQTVLDRLQVRLYGEPFYLHPPAYFFLEALLLKILHPVGDVIQQIYAARFLNVILGALSSLLIYQIGRRLAGWKAGLTAALLFALDPFSIRTNSQTLLETSAVFWALLGWWPLFQAAARGHFRKRDIVWSGMSFGLALLTKDMLVFLTMLPLGVCFLSRWAVPRRVAGWTLLTAVLTYLPYPVIVFLVGDGRLLAEAKLSGLARFLGATKTTGFKRAGGPSLIQALASNLQTFGTTYLLVAMGAVAVVMLWRWRSGQPLQRLLALLVTCAYALLAFAVLIGTLEEQFFYYLTVPAMLAVSVAFWNWRADRGSAGRRGVSVAGVMVAVMFCGWTLFTWAALHLSPSNGYQVLRAYLTRHVPPNSRIATLTEESVFLTGGYITGVWKDSDALRGSQVQYVILSTQQVARGYGYATPALKTWLDAHAQLLTSVPSRSYGALNLYKLPTSQLGGLPNSDVARGRAGWLFLPSEYQADPATLADPTSAGAYAADTIVRIGRLLREQHQALQVLLVPAKSRVYAPFLPSGLVVSPAISQRYTRTLSTLQHSGLLAPNLAEAFQAARLKPNAQKLFLKQDHHWTPQGAQVAAVAAVQNLQGQVNLSDLPAVTTTATVLPEATSAYRSLYHLLPPATQRQFLPERYRPLQVQVQQRGANLLGDSAPGVVLVGSSFSASPEFSFSPLLERQLGHDVLNVSDPGQGAWVPLLTYLRTATYRDSPPHLLIWEFWENFLNNRGVGTVPFGYLLNVAASIMNSCPANGIALAAAQPDPSTGAQTISVAGATSPLGDYLHLQVTAPGHRTLQGEFMGDEPAYPFTVPLPGDSGPQDVNIPLFASAGHQTRQVRLVAGGAGFSVSEPQLCHLPSYVSDSSYSKLGHLDLLQSSAPPGTQLTGLGEIETTGHRWGVGKQISVSFFSTSNRQVRLQVKFRAPISGQGVRISMNGLPLFDRTHLVKDDVTDLHLTLQVRSGLNIFTLTPVLQNVGVSRFSPKDPRPTTVEFTEFLLVDQ